MKAGNGKPLLPEEVRSYCYDMLSGIEAMAISSRDSALASAVRRFRQSLMNLAPANANDESGDTAMRAADWSQ